VYVTAVEIEGFRGAAQWSGPELGRVVELPPGPIGVAIADALSIVSASLDGDRIAPPLRTLGLLHGGEVVDVVEENGLPVQFRVFDPASVSALVDLERTRQLSVRVRFTVDPPLYGRLRELAAREPRLVTALGQDPRIRLKVGWLFSQDLGVVAIGVTEVAIGGVMFPGSGPERPSWMGPLLKDLAGRFARVDGGEPIDAVTRRLYEASLASDPAVRARYLRTAAALGEAPFGLGALGWVRSRGLPEARLGSALLGLRQVGPAGAEALRLVEAVHQRAPDVLVVEAPGAAQRDPKAVREWLAHATEGDGATLEQVFLVPGGAA